MDDRARPNQPARSPSTTVTFARSVPVALRAISPMGTENTSRGTTPASGTASGATPVWRSYTTTVAPLTGSSVPNRGSPPS